MGKYDNILHPEFKNYPEIRWWLAQGYHTDKVLEENVQKLHDMGFSGCEVLTLTEESIDRQLYGWGSEEFNHDMMTIAKKATELGMGFSFTSGPDWQPAIPGLNINDEASGQELNFANVNVKAGETYEGELLPYQHIHLDYRSMAEVFGIPMIQGPNTNVYPKDEDLVQRFVAAVAVRLTNAEDIDKVDLNKKRSIDPPFGMPNPDPEQPYDTVLLELETSVDITSKVEEKDGRYYVKWQAPEDGNYVIFTFWRHSTCQVADSGYETAVTINHLDVRGPEAQIKYWDEHIFTPEMDAIIAKNGNVDFFQDSLEIRTLMSSGLWWSEHLLEEFKKRRGYDLTPYLPSLINYNIRNFGGPSKGPSGDHAQPRFVFNDHPEMYRELLDDLHMTQTDMYREYYLQPIRKWLNSHGVKLRAQASYGSPCVAFEMTLQQDSLDLQETETLEMSDVIDFYRVHSGGVHMYKQNTFSCETGAVGGRSYGVPLKEYLWKVHRMFAGGLNRPIFHGYAVPSGPDASTQWPGYDGIGFIFSERWGDRHPYGFAIKDFTTYLARLQTALRAGTPKMDVGILNLMFESPEMDGSLGSGAKENEPNLLFYKDDKALARAGYTYEFFAPQYLERFTSDGKTFDSGNTEYRALVVWQESVPESSAAKLLEYAKAGLPVVIVEGAGQKALGMHEDSQAVKEVFAKLKELPNVAVAPDKQGVPAALKRLGVIPRVAFSEPSDLYTVWRDLGDTKYVYVMNAGNTDVRAELCAEGEFTPVWIDCWTGTAAERGQYKVKDGRTSFAVSIEAGDAALYILEPYDGRKHIEKGMSFYANASEDKLCGAAARPGAHTFVLSDGSEQTVSVEPKTVAPITEWDVTVEDWTAGEKREITEDRGLGYTTTEYYYDTNKAEISLKLSGLKSWDEIPEVGKDVSGKGHYCGRFNIPEDWDENDGLIVDLGVIHEMAMITVNGKKVQCVDMMSPKADITAALQPGENLIQIDVSTTLYNRLAKMGRYQGGPFFGGTIEEYQKYGLVKCELKSYRRFEI